FRRYVIATAGLAYTDQDYDNVPITESELRTSLLLEYYLNREWTLFGQWETIDFDSNQPGNSWTANDVRVGARWRQ
ncbi:MAG: outer membrane beta-barrel protein, partial [Hyphomicrobium sp.]